MGRIKDYFEFSQLLHWLSTEALQIMLETEADSFRASIITNEIEARHVKPASAATDPRNARTDPGSRGQA
jgi:hypothetical protein